MYCSTGNYSKTLLSKTRHCITAVGQWTRNYTRGVFCFPFWATRAFVCMLTQRERTLLFSQLKHMHRGTLLSAKRHAMTLACWTDGRIGAWLVMAASSSVVRWLRVHSRPGAVTQTTWTGSQGTASVDMFLLKYFPRGEMRRTSTCHDDGVVALRAPEMRYTNDSRPQGARQRHTGLHRTSDSDMLRLCNFSATASRYMGMGVDD